MPPELFPIEVVMSRYGGQYEGGGWLAWPNAQSCPGQNDAAFGERDICEAWWVSDPFAERVGRGATPNGAVTNMLTRAAAIAGRAEEKTTSGDAA
jgi:hypothetical protein